MYKTDGKPRQSSHKSVTATEATSPAPLEYTERRKEVRARVGLNLFWRTFFLLSVLLVGSILAWLQTLRALEFEPRALQTAQQIASLSGGGTTIVATRPGGDPYAGLPPLF